MIRPFLDATPLIPATCSVAESADIIGDVTVGEQSSIWYNVTVRSDVNWIRIGFVFYSKGHTA